MVLRLAGILSLAMLLGAALPAGAEEVHLVTVTDEGFEPAQLTIQRGDVVRWEWESGRHTITSGDSPLDENAGEIFDLVVDEANPVQEWVGAKVGTVPYFSQFLPETARGTITVADATPVSRRTGGWLKKAFEGSGPAAGTRR